MKRAKKAVPKKSRGSRLRSYRVVWRIDVEATSPKKAAIEARKCQRPGTTATVFDVYDQATLAYKQIDLGVVD